jgi:hypothetical protein
VLPTSRDLDRGTASSGSACCDYMSRVHPASFVASRCLSRPNACRLITPSRGPSLARTAWPIASSMQLVMPAPARSWAISSTAGRTADSANQIERTWRCRGRSERGLTERGLSERVRLPRQRDAHRLPRVGPPAIGPRWGGPPTPPAFEISRTGCQTTAPQSFSKKNGWSEIFVSAGPDGHLPEARFGARRSRQTKR